MRTIDATWQSDDGRARLYLGDCRDVLPELGAVDAVVTDPPYGLRFMGKHWDYDVPDVELWRLVLAACKPGAHLLSFAGTRTQHRMAVNIEDAGFEIRDMIAWVYGSGFPKSLDVGKAIDKAAGAEREVVGYSRGVAVAEGDNQFGGINRGSVGVKQTAIDVPITAPATDAARQWAGWGTALKPALEPITVARRPLDGTVAENVLRHGTGAINVDACRIPSGDGRTGDDSTVSNGRGRTGDQRSRTGCTSDLAGRLPQHAPSKGLLASVPGCENQQTQPQDSPGDCQPCPRCGGVPVRLSQADGQAFSPQQRDGREPLCRCATEHDNRDCLSTYEPPFVEDKDTTPHIESQEGQRKKTTRKSDKYSGRYNGGKDGHYRKAEEYADANPAGRWPANLIHDGSDEVVGLFPVTKPTKPHPITSNVQKYEGYGNITRKRGETVNYDEGVEPQSAARFFKCCPMDDPDAEVKRLVYCSKASKADRDEGCEGLEERVVRITEGHGRGDINTSKEDGTGIRENRPRRNTCPCVKPTALMRYLCRLVTPPGGVVLDPFMGSGSTGKAAIAEGFRFIGIERDAESFEIAKARIRHALGARDGQGMLAL